jgi:hypothetical protein
VPASTRTEYLVVPLSRLAPSLRLTAPGGTQVSHVALRGA